MQYFVPEEIKRTISILKPDNELFEIRIIRGNNILSGYFRDPDTLIHELARQDLERSNVYITLQKLHEGCEARLQWQQFMNSGREKVPTTSDNDIVQYEWLPIDLDPVRPAGISSSLEELKHAQQMKNDIVEYMELIGFFDPITAFSGNGFHLLYRFEHDAKEGEQAAGAILEELDDAFSNEHCHVDTTNKNPARIFKLYGTLAQKGRHTETRPHRMSRIL